MYDTNVNLLLLILFLSIELKKKLWTALDPSMLFYMTQTFNNNTKECNSLGQDSFFAGQKNDKWIVTVSLV